MESVLFYQSLPYVFEIIYFKIISACLNNPLAQYFRIEKTRKLIVRKYFWSIFY